jgi:hypothetical protein
VHCAENNSISLKDFLSLLSSLFPFLFDNLVSVLCLFASSSRVVGGCVGFEAIVDLDLERFFALGGGALVDSQTLFCSEVAFGWLLVGAYFSGFP